MVPLRREQATYDSTRTAGSRGQSYAASHGGHLDRGPIQHQTMVMSIPPEKIKETLVEITEWIQHSTIELKPLQKLLGRVFHATKCCTPARLFCNRLLDGLRVAYREGKVALGMEMRLDLFWLLSFMAKCNGQHLMRPAQPQHIMTDDSCLSGGGGTLAGEMYTAQYSPGLLECQWHISQLEIYNILLAIRWWQARLRNTNVLVHCDNAASVAVLQAGQSADVLMRGCAREVWLLCCLNDIELSVKHLPGKDNTDADILSRAHLGKRQAQALHSLQNNRGVRAIALPDTFMLPPTCI